MSRTYMVVGYYEDGGRYATTVEASSGERPDGSLKQQCEVEK